MDKLSITFLVMIVLVLGFGIYGLLEKKDKRDHKHNV